MRKFYFVLKLLLVAFAFSYCNQPANDKIQRKVVALKPVNYHLQSVKDWMLKNGSDSPQNIIPDVNRTDKAHLAAIDSIIVPDDINADRENYFPFPISVPYLKNIGKIIFFSYPSQSFGAYEFGELTYTGPVNMGRKKDPTPTGLYYTNWKAEKTTSTFNDEWDLHWNFNIDNKAGIGWHQYGLPGYPASHSCLRLLEKDARYLYNWADEWIMDKDSIKAQGTPVIVFGSYPFDSAKPWLKLIADPHALDISPAQIHQEAAPFLENILLQKKRREAQIALEK